MPIALFSFKIDNSDEISVAHVFFGTSKADAEAKLKAHAGACPQFGPAFRERKTIEFAREIEELPPADGDDLEDWLDTYFTAEDEDSPEVGGADEDEEESEG